ncbi:MAG: DUF4433 domain-containing protein [Mangrovibacterium sp.]
MILNKTYLFRMIHIRNIPHILEYGLTHKNSPSANSDFVPIGDTSLISFRDLRKVFVTNGLSNNKNAEEIILGDFIPFYFGPRMPMLFVIQKGGNFVPGLIPAEQIVYCITSIQKVINHKLKFYFSNGHATNHFTDFFNEEMVNNIENIIDFTAVKAKYWNIDDDLDLKRRKEAEFLIQGDVPVSCILGYVCYNEDVKRKLVSYGITETMILIKKSYYF